MKAKATPADLCPNCAKRFPDLTGTEHTESGCLLGLLVGVIQGRELVVVTSATVAAFEDVDGLWDRWGGPAADELEDTIKAASGTAASAVPNHESPDRKEG